MKLVEFVPPVPHPLWKLCPQMGITDVIVKVNPELTGLSDPWRYETLQRIVGRLADAGLRVIGLEGDPFDMGPIKEYGAGEDLSRKERKERKDSTPKWDRLREEALAHYRELLESMGRLGIHLLCYNFMVGKGWSRTGVRDGRGGAKATYFSSDDFSRKEHKESDNPTIPQSHNLRLTAEQVWANYEYFIKSVLPTAEKCGVRMALHPDDPPLPSLGGYARIFGSVEAYDRAYALYPSPSNAITFCQANFKLMGVDLESVARHFRDRIAFIHIRDVEGTKEDFTELFHDQGTTDQFALMRAYREIGLDVPVRGDHVPEMAFDRELTPEGTPGYFTLGRLFANGYLKALLKEEGGAPVAGTFDLVVAGGSATGVCAAVTAARAGLKVAIVEYNAFFGGMATAALVPVWHSLYSTDGKTRIIGGLTEEIERRLMERGEAELTEPGDPGVGCYFNTAALQLVLDELVAEQPTITTFFKAQVVAAEKDREGHLTAAIIEDKSGHRALRAKWFIDATGDADLASRAGFETWTPPKGQLQAHTLCAIFANVRRFQEKYGAAIFHEVLKPAFGAGLGHVFGWEAPVVGAGDLRFFAGTRVSNCDPSVAEDLTGGLFEARRQIRKIIDAVNRRYPMPQGERLALVSLGSDLGIRESRHIKAKYRVTAEDVLYGRHFEDCVAKGSYRVDIHEGRGITFRYLDGTEQSMEVGADGEVVWREGRWRTDDGERPTWYEIPLRALQPERAENLICAGRMIDCEREAFGALRVMVNCNQMGEAAANHAVRELSAASSASNR